MCTGARRPRARFRSPPAREQVGASHASGLRPQEVDAGSTPVASPQMDFVLTLHGHLPYVLHHGRWPHGSVWLCEGALDSYLPLIEALQALERERIPAPITLGITPVLANQLAHPSFVSEFDAYMERRLESAAGAGAWLPPARAQEPLPVAHLLEEGLRPRR